MNFLDQVTAHAQTMPVGAPPIPVAHPTYGLLGSVDRKGFHAEKDRQCSTAAIVRDSSRIAIKALRSVEDAVPVFGSKIAKWVQKNPTYRLPTALGAISSYDGIVTSRGSGLLQDVWMAMTTTQTPVTLSWYDMMSFVSWTPMTAPTITAYTNAGTGGAVLDATANGSWISNPGSSNKKYIVSMGLTTTSITGFSFGMLYDCLWAGSYSLTTNATINPTTDVTVTRYASTTAGNADYAGGNMLMTTLTSTLTHSVAGTVTTTYTDQAGTAGKTTISITPATGALLCRTLFNTTHNSATVITSTPFMSMSNAGSSGVTKLEQIVVSGGTITVGTVVAKIVRPLIFMPFIAANSYIEQDSTLNIGNMLELRNVSQVCGCLSWSLFSAGTTAASMSAFMRTVEG